MSRTFASPRHQALVQFLRDKRIEAGLTQADVAERLGRWQSFVTDYERGQKRIDAVELLAIAECIGFPPEDAIRHIKKVKS